MFQPNFQIPQREITYRVWRAGKEKIIYFEFNQTRPERFRPIQKFYLCDSSLYRIKIKANEHIKLFQQPPKSFAELFAVQEEFSWLPLAGIIKTVPRVGILSLRKDLHFAKFVPKKVVPTFLAMNSFCVEFKPNIKNSSLSQLNLGTKEGSFKV